MLKPVIEYFLSKINVVESGCWEWSGCLDHHGYSHFNDKSSGYKGHRFIYSYFFGDIKSNLVLDHLCKNTKCCNPNHLEQVTQRENILRGSSLFAMKAKQTHCKRGHEFNNTNTYYRKDRPNTRTCRVCSYNIRKKHRNMNNLIVN